MTPQLIMKNAFNPKTRKQLAEAYGVSRRTLYNWLSELGFPPGRKLLKEKCLILLYAEHGNPYKNKPKIITK